MGADLTIAGADLHGLIVPDARISLERLAAQGTGPLASSFTQAGPRPGIAEPDQTTGLVLRTSGTQSANGDLEVRTQRGGGLAQDRAGFVWRDVAAGDTTSEYKGWDGPQLLTGWDSLLFTTLAEGANIWPDVIRLVSGRLMAVWSTTTLGVLRVSIFDPATEAWTARNLTPTGAGSGYAVQVASIVQLPSGRVLCFVNAPDVEQIDVYGTDDEGVTWSPLGTRVLHDSVLWGISITPHQLRARYSAGEILLVYCFEDGGTRAANSFASSDLGARFERVGLGPTTPRWFGMVAVPGGGFICAYRNATFCEVILAPSAFTVLSGLTPTTVGVAHAGNGSVSIHRDEDGRVLLYALADRVGTDGMDLFSSDDQGVTWTEYRRNTLQGNGADYFDLFQSESLAGRICLLSRWTASGATQDPQSVSALWFGGYSSHTAPASNLPSPSLFLNYKDRNYISWGMEETFALDRRGWWWLPIERPGDMGWTAAGAGTDALSAGLLAMDTTANQRTFTFETADGGESLFADLCLRLDAGSGDDATERVVAKFRVTDWDGASNTFDYEVSLRFDDTGFTLYNNNGATTLGSVNVSLTTLLRLRLHVDSSGNVRCWYARPGYVRSWTAGPSGVLTNNGATGLTQRAVFGHGANGTDGSDWESVLINHWAGLTTGAHTGAAAASWSNPLDLHPRSYSTLSAGLRDGVQIAALDGPTFQGETQRIATDYDFPARVVLPEIDPSPRRVWRTTADNVDAVLVWDLTGDTTGGRLLNHSIGCFLLGANIREANLEYYDGAAWQPLLALDASDGWTTLPFRRDGDVVFLDPGVAAASRWLSYGAAINGTFQLSTDTFRRVVENSEGAWEDAPTKRPWLRLAGTSAADPTVGTGRLMMPAFGGIKHEWNTDARYLRLKIPAQLTADGYYEVGQIVIGSCVVFGLRYSRGWSVTRRAQVQESRWRDGQSRVRRLGPPERTWELSWTDGADAGQFQGNAASPDYVTGSASGLEVAARHDGPRLLDGVLDSLDGPVNPVLLLPRIPRGTGSQLVTNPSGIVWGRLSAESSLDNVLGEEGVDEVERSGRFVIRELA